MVIEAAAEGGEAVACVDGGEEWGDAGAVGVDSGGGEVSGGGAEFRSVGGGLSEERGDGSGRGEGNGDEVGFGWAELGVCGEAQGFG
ncbi:MAG: hypothetical protein DVB22_002277 [Verrucomicrobia bacterium]|nr:MAG: hypothetical protein DVB22_002277 [Verrucomicrobiota bacterium]